MTVIHKATARAAGENPLEFVMSDPTVDRYGDVIEPSGWDLRNFRNNPVALFGHDAQLPVGVWKNVRVERNALRGELEFLPEGRSPRVDEIRAFVETGMLRAVSVGFTSVDAEMMPDKSGVRYKKTELVECSVVSIPANPNALAVAKALHLSDDAQRLIFGKSADEISAIRRRGMSGEPAVDPQLHRRNAKMPTLSERITIAQTDLTQLKDQLTEHLKAENPDEIVTGELSDQIEQKEGALAALQRAEKALATKTATPPSGSGEARRPFASAAKKSEPKDLIVRAAVVQLLSHVEKRSMQEVLIGRYGEDEAIKTTLDVIARSAVAPAMTTTSGWAAELVQTAVLDFIDALMPISVYPTLRDLGGRFTFGPNGIVSIPSRAATPSIGGSFVGQGAPIPVRRGGFSATTLTPKKIAVITPFTREIALHSTPAIEGVLRQAILEDSAVAIDSVLLDTNAATSIRPAGLRNGVTGATATTGGGLAALTGDLKALAAALISASNGNLRAPVWVMNPVQKLSIAMAQSANGDFPFKAEIADNTLMGYPIIASATVAAGTVMFVDAADFFSATGDDPRFDVSDQATLHMEDTSPAAIGTAGTPNVVAAPVQSLFQTDSIALRMIMDMNWAMRRSGMVAFVTGVTW